MSLVIRASDQLPQTHPVDSKDLTLVCCCSWSVFHDRLIVQREEAELEKLREKERIRSGKELLEAKRQEDDLQLKRNLELRRIEKAEEARARDKIRIKLGMLHSLAFSTDGKYVLLDRQ